MADKVISQKANYAEDGADIRKFLPLQEDTSNMNYTGGKVRNAAAVLESLTKHKTKGEVVLEGIRAEAANCDTMAANNGGAAESEDMRAFRARLRVESEALRKIESKMHADMKELDDVIVAVRGSMEKDDMEKEEADTKTKEELLAKIEDLKAKTEKPRAAVKDEPKDGEGVINRPDDEIVHTYEKYLGFHN